MAVPFTVVATWAAATSRGAGGTWPSLTELPPQERRRKSKERGESELLPWRTENELLSALARRPDSVPSGEQMPRHSRKLIERRGGAATWSLSSSGRPSSKAMPRPTTAPPSSPPPHGIEFVTWLNSTADEIAPLAAADTLGTLRSDQPLALQDSTLLRRCAYEEHRDRNRIARDAHHHLIGIMREVYHARQSLTTHRQKLLELVSLETAERARINSQRLREFAQASQDVSLTVQRLIQRRNLLQRTTCRTVAPGSSADAALPLQRERMRTAARSTSAALRTELMRNLESDVASSWRELRRKRASASSDEAVRRRASSIRNTSPLPVAQVRHRGVSVASSGTADDPSDTADNGEPPPKLVLLRSSLWQRRGSVLPVYALRRRSSVAFRPMGSISFSDSSTGSVRRESDGAASDCHHILPAWAKRSAVADDLRSLLAGRRRATLSTPQVTPADDAPQGSDSLGELPPFDTPALALRNPDSREVEPWSLAQLHPRGRSRLVASAQLLPGDAEKEDRDSEAAARWVLYGGEPPAGIVALHYSLSQGAEGRRSSVDDDLTGTVVEGQRFALRGVSSSIPSNPPPLAMMVLDENDCHGAASCHGVQSFDGSREEHLKTLSSANSSSIFSP